MGAGKTTVARIVAARTGRPHIDTDDEVERALGATVTEIFAGRGEDAFRRAESEALRRVTDGAVPAVVSVGGGMVLDPANRRAMADAGTVVWLRARPDTLAARASALGDQPLLHAGGETPADVLARLAAARRPYYEEVAGAVVDVDDLSAEEVADRVVACLGTVSGGVP